VAERNGKTQVYVTQFLAQLVDDARPIDQKEGRDDGREGRVGVIDAATDTLVKTIKLSAKATGFQSDGSTLDKTVSDGTAATKVDTLAFPNQLESIVVRGNRAYLPNTASSPNGPVKFNVNVQAFVSVIDLDADQEAVAETFNMNKGVQLEAVGKKLFPTNPAALAFKHNGSFEGFVLSRATDRLVRLVLDANNSNYVTSAESRTIWVYVETQAQFWQDYLTLWQRTTQKLLGQETEPVIEPAKDDRRFKHEQWSENAAFDFIKQSYLLSARCLHGTVKGADGLDPTTHQNVRREIGAELSR